MLKPSVLFLALVLGLAGCGTVPSGPAPSEALTIMGNASNLENPYIQRIFELYEREAGGRIEVIPLENETYNDEVLARVDGRPGEPAPDIVMLFNNSLMDELGGVGRFRDLSDQPWVGDLVDGARAYSSDADGALLGLPFWESSVSGTYYNRRMLEELGVRPATTQAEFDRLCGALASIGYTPIALGNEGCYSYYQFGLDPVVADHPEVLERLNAGELVYSDIPEVVAMVRWMKDAADAGWFGDTTDIPYEELGQAMGNGAAAMVFAWDTWFDTDFEEGRYSKGDFGLMPVFIGTEPEGTYEGGNLNLFAVNRASANQDRALQFLAFCADPANYNRAFDGISTGSVFKGQTTNVTSPMVEEVREDLARKGRVSTAEPKIKGYDARAINLAMHQLYRGRIGVDQCLRLMDESLESARDR